MPETKVTLEKSLRPLDAVMIVVGNVVGVGIFTTTGFIAGDLSDAWLILGVWLFGGMLTLFGLFPESLGRAHPQFRTPFHSIALQAVASCLMVMVGNFYQLLSYTVFFMLMTSIATAAGVLILRFRLPGLSRPYRVWGYPITTLAFVFAYAWIAVRIFLHNPQNALIGIGITLSGIPFFILWNRRSQRAGAVTSRVYLPVLVAFLVLPSLACAHGMLHQIVREDAVIVSAQYDDGEPVSYADVKVYSPVEGKIAHQTGRTDRNGRFAIIPDSAGEWKIIVDGGMGHLIETAFTVNETFDVETDKQAGGALPRWQGILVGLGVIFGLSGFIYGRTASKRAHER